LEIPLKTLIPFENIKKSPEGVFEIVDEYGQAVLLKDNLPAYIITRAETIQSNPDIYQEPTKASPYTLHDAMCIVLKEAPDNQMHASDLADAIFEQSLYFQRSGDKADYNQIRARVGHYPDLFEALPGNIIRLRIENIKSNIGRVSNLDRQAFDIDSIWRRIIALEGEIFRQKQGQEFTFTVKGEAIVPSTTNWNIPKSSFEKALAYVPLKNVSIIQRVCQGPSYVYAILMDQRIRNGLW